MARDFIRGSADRVMPNETPSRPWRGTFKGRQPLAWIAIALTLCAPSAWAEPERLVIFAAASLTDALQRVSMAYSRETGIEVRHSFAASSTLARQIEHGARVHVFFSADPQWMDYLDQRALIIRRSRVAVLANRLALIAPQQTHPQQTHPEQTAPRAAPAPIIRSAEALRHALRPLQDPRHRLIVADPQSVPLGRYSRAALESLNAWKDVRSRVAIADNARAALSLIARGESPLGIVYESDALSNERVHILGIFDETLHPPVIYPVALTQEASGAAQRYLDFLRSDDARQIFIESGFQILSGPSSATP